MNAFIRSHVNQHTYVAIMAGGIGSRFWPVSRTDLPKQFLDILGTGRTLIQQTLDRFLKLVPIEHIFVVTSDDYMDLVTEQLPELPKNNIIGEPYRKNTAPCVAYISFKLQQLDPEASLIVAPADHLILDQETFGEICAKALSFVAHLNALVTIGIKPTHPNTGYGYIQYETAEVAPQVNKVKTFTEKPNLELAQAFVASGEFLWNAGIFVWKVVRVIDAFRKYMPEMYDLFAGVQQQLNTGAEAAAISEVYPQCSNISIDFGIMEKAENVYVIPAAFGWSDLGTWNSAWENMDKDYLENAVVGNHVMVIDAQRCVVHAPDNKVVLLQGLDNYIIVDTKDVLLICQKEKENEIKEFVGEVKRNYGEQFL